MSSKPLDIIKPKLLNDDVVSSFFTLKNAHLEDGEIPGLNLGFNTKELSSRVESNRTKLLTELELDDIATAKQIHGSDALYVTEGGIYENVDALVTDIKGLALGIQVADCGAVLLVDTVHKVIGVAHAGWRGAISGVVEHTISLMVKKGAIPEKIKAFISPCISLQNFEVGSEVASQFPERVVDYQSYRKPHIDLPLFIVNTLIEQGLTKDRIEVDGRCTIELSELFYSYRREQEKSGRMMGIIKLNEA